MVPSSLPEKNVKQPVGSENAGRVYEGLYTPEVNYRQTMAIYDEAAQAAC